MRKILLSVTGWLFIAFLSLAQDTIPQPTVYLNFNSDWFTTENKLGDNATKVPLSEGVAQDAVWYNYNGNFPPPYAGYRDGDTLKFGGAAFFSGYKSVCNDDPSFPGDNSPAASRDVLFFAGNDNVDNWDVIDTSSYWQGVRKSFTLAYWWRSERALTANTINACPDDNQLPDWGEEETQFDGGAFNGIDILCYYNYYKIGWRNGSDGVDDAHVSGYFVPSKDDGTPDAQPEPGEWVHVAVTFDGSTGELTLYLNGTLAVDWEGNPANNPNPIQTGYSQFDAVSFDPDVVGTPYGAVLFGATNGPSPSGKNSGGAFWGEVPQYEGKYGYIEDHYRLGWPARGYLDEFAYWKDTVLTQDQIKTVMNNEIEQLLNPTGISKKYVNDDLFNIYPNPSDGEFTVNLHRSVQQGGKVEIYNTLGAKIYEEALVPGDQQVRIDKDLAPGLYMIKTSVGEESGVRRVIIK